jgi:hypothetical protein
MAFGRGMFGSATTVTVKTSPTPLTASSPVRNEDDFKLPTRDQQDFTYATTPIIYNPTFFGTPPPGRNIFAFYEPPPPCPTCPTPTPKPTQIPTPVPTPTPPMTITYVTPQTIYAGSGSFRLEINGEKIDPASRIYFNQSELPTRFISSQKLVADVPSTMIASEGPRQVLIQTPDGKLYSNQIMINVQEPPKPQFLYVGMIGRVRHNNDTAVFREGTKPEFAARLNDVVAGRFRVVSISPAQAIVQDVNLGFKHPLKIYQPPAGSTTSSGSGPVRGGFPAGGTYVPYNPNMPNPNVQPQDIPGIPSNIPRYQPPANVQRPAEKKAEDEDDDGDGN